MPCWVQVQFQCVSISKSVEDEYTRLSETKKYFILYHSVVQIRENTCSY